MYPITMKDNSNIVMTETDLYSRRDIIGWILSEWRARSVLPYVSGTLMDLACGDNRLVKKYGSGVGVDIVKYLGVDVVCPDLSRLPFGDDEFDTITILAALNYFDDPVSVLHEVSRVLKSEGTLLVTFLDQRVSRLWHSFKERVITPRPAFNKAELVRCLKAADLVIVQRKHFMFGLNSIYFIKKRSNHD
jgi:SAM-dependent methyltransferase